jgi:1-acyl-sn-glycerol-3-phosphate acyltransferase
MIYKLLKLLTSIAFKIYFRKIYFLNADQIPEKNPVLLASNHPSAFLEPCVFAAYLIRPLHFLTRGDLFASGFKWFLEATHQVPIFRFRDGFSNMRANQDTFKICNQKLSEGNMILIFSEAQTLFERKVRPIQKGTAKMAFSAVDYDETIDLCIIPAGVTYSDPREFRSIAVFQFSSPIWIRDYWDKFRNNPKDAITEVTEILSDEIHRNTIHIENAQREKPVGLLFEMCDNEVSDPAFPVFVTRTTLLEKWQKTVFFINNASEDVYERFTLKAEKYQELLLKLKICDSSVRKGAQVTLMIIPVLVSAILIGATGYLLNFIPGLIALGFTNRRVSKPSFYGPVLASSGFVLYFLYYLLIFLGLYYFFGWISVFWTLLIFLLGVFYFVNIRWIRSMLGALRFKWSPAHVQDEVVALRNSILESIFSNKIIEVENM